MVCFKSQDPLPWRRQYCRGLRQGQEGKNNRRDNETTYTLAEMKFGAEDNEMWNGSVATSSVVPSMLRD